MAIVLMCSPFSIVTHCDTDNLQTMERRSSMLAAIKLEMDTILNIRTTMVFRILRMVSVTFCHANITKRTIQILTGGPAALATLIRSALGVSSTIIRRQRAVSYIVRTIATSDSMLRRTIHVRYKSVKRLS